MNLFENIKDSGDENNRPLAYRMRPRNLKEFFGQEEIVGENKLLSSGPSGKSLWPRGGFRAGNERFSARFRKSRICAKTY